MATPTLTEDFTQVHPCDVTTGISTIGTTKASQETDNYMEGSASCGFEQKTTSSERKGGYDTHTSTNLTGKYIAIWVFITAQQSITTLAAGGVRVYVGDGTNWGEWYVGGNDTPWTGSGWKRVVVNCDTAFDNNSGTDPTISTITQTGIVWYPTSLLGKLPGMFMDDIQIGGSYYEVTAGTSGDPVTLDDILTADTNNFGAIVKNRAGLYEVNMPITIGDQSGATNTFFKTENEVIAFADQRLDGDAGIYLTEDTGTTGFQVGSATGTGDSRVGYGGSVFFHEGTAIGGTASNYQIDAATTAVDTCDVYAATFIDAANGCAFSTDTTHEVISSSFVHCGQTDLGAVIARNLTFSGYTLDTDAALLWNGSINIKNSDFLGCTDGTNDPHAIEHPAAGTFDYYGLNFGGNDYDINFSASTGNLVIGNQPGSNASSYEVTSTGGTVTINTTVTLKVTVKDTDGVAVVSAQTAIYQESDDTELMNEDTIAGGIASESFNYTTDTPVYIRVRKSSTGSTRYKNAFAGGTITADGLDVTITLQEESVA